MLPMVLVHCISMRFLTNCFHIFFNKHISWVLCTCWLLSYLNMHQSSCETLSALAKRYLYLCRSYGLPLSHIRYDNASEGQREAGTWVYQQGTHVAYKLFPPSRENVLLHYMTQLTIFCSAGVGIWPFFFGNTVFPISTFTDFHTTNE